MLQLAVPYAVDIAAAYTPMVLQWPPRSLLTSDNPVLLISDGSPVSLSVTTAGGMFIAVDDATGLLLWNHECWGDPPRNQFRPTQAKARELNQAVVAQSVRQVLWHPEATSEQLLGSEFVFPPYRTQIAPAHIDEQCRKIAGVLEGATHELAITASEIAVETAATATLEPQPDTPDPAPIQAVTTGGVVGTIRLSDNDEVSLLLNMGMPLNIQVAPAATGPALTISLAPETDT